MAQFIQSHVAFLKKELCAKGILEDGQYTLADYLAAFRHQTGL